LFPNQRLAAERKESIMKINRNPQPRAVKILHLLTKTIEELKRVNASVVTQVTCTSNQESQIIHLALYVPVHR